VDGNNVDFQGTACRAPTIFMYDYNAYARTQMSAPLLWK